MDYDLMNRLWIAISIQSDARHALLEEMGSPAWALADRFPTAVGRRRHEDELDAKLTQFSVEQSMRPVSVCNISMYAPRPSAALSAQCRHQEHGAEISGRVIK
jgi:hypothetical protein